MRARCENFIDGVHVSTDFGLAEINYAVKDITPEVLRRVYDPLENLKIMHAMWKERGFGPSLLTAINHGNVREGLPRHDGDRRREPG